MDGDERGPPSAATERWQELLDDAAAVADEYRENGWETLVLSTGDVTPLADDPFGLDVVAPTEEFEALEALVEGASFDTSHVFRDEDDGLRFLIIAIEASDHGAAVVVPAFLSLDEEASLAERAQTEGTMYTHVRPPDSGGRVTFTHDEPELFF
ncbi:MAG: hypothetical protein ACI8UR_002079 [Natronomonas sp.]|jgi:hypothetical protein|uniref:DUF7529 family protein n=1 Tax=Natronomonas sp. TaxID=2184060 RepID=UPI00398929B7